jgi:diaminohydroxyphosphoribosylaminopyrimidine deaminase / 5-amino-6-(5-phosphoribosylamino)uracil reductase
MANSISKLLPSINVISAIATFERLMHAARMSFDAIDQKHMQAALQLAALAPYSTRPNPRVGCVIAKGEQVLGQGYHLQAGGPHAEVFALIEAGADAKGATAYVTLEPCAHTGRTPPCADALIHAGIARVVIANIDPFDQVDGQGVHRLKAAGITVDTGLLHAQARALNLGFFSRVERARPWVRIKMAASLDGKTALANGQSQWITSALARTDGHTFRALACAIVSGIGTVLADDPSLDVRIDDIAALRGQFPRRIIADRHLRMPLFGKIWHTKGDIIVAHGEDVDPIKRQKLLGQGARCWSIDGRSDTEFLHALMRKLNSEQTNDIHVEAGARLAGAFFRAGLVDQLLLYQAPVLLGGGAKSLLDWPDLQMMDEKIALHLVDHQLIGPDQRHNFWTPSALGFANA